MQYIECIQTNQQLSFRHFNCYECRGINTEGLIKEAISKFNITKDLHFFVQTDDCNYNILQGQKLYNTVTDKKEYNKTFPDFFYHSWPEIKVLSYNDLIYKLNSITDEPATNKVGWIGTLLCNKRKELYDMSTKLPFLDIIPMNWTRTNNVQLSHTKYMSYEEQILKWKYLIDVEGGGYSARAKIFLSTNRICFIVDRKYEEWFHQFLIPWENYIPVKNDLSDLETNYQKIESDIELQKYILNNQKKLFDKCLTKEAAIGQINNILINEY